MHPFPDPAPSAPSSRCCGSSVLVEALESRLHFSATFATTETHIYSEGYPPELNGGAVVADFDGDGVNDLAVTNGLHIEFMRGRGDGTFSNAVVTRLTSRAGLIAAGNFDGSGGNDLVAVGQAGNNPPGVANPMYNARGYMLRALTYDNGSGGLVVRTHLFVPLVTEIPYFDDGIELTQLHVGNVLGGARDEIVVRLVRSTLDAGNTRTFIGIYATPGASAGAIDGIVLRSTVFDRTYPFDSPGDVNIQLADLNGDGRVDVMFCPGKVWRAELYPKAGTWTTPANHRVRINLFTGQTPTYEDTLDTFAGMDGDGKADRIAVATLPLMAGMSHPVRVSITFGSGSGTFGLAVASPVLDLREDPSGGFGDFTPMWVAAIVPQVTDLDGDGRVDLVLGAAGYYSDFEGHEVHAFSAFGTLLQGIDGNFASSDPLAAVHHSGFPDSTKTPSFLADVNNDGRPDLVYFDDENDGGLTVSAQLNITPH